MRDSLIPDTNQTTVKPTVIIEFPLGTFTGTNGHRVIDVEPIFIKLGSAGASTRIVIENSDIYGTKIDTLWNRNNPVNGSAVTITAEIDGTDFDVFDGAVLGVSDWSLESVSFECSSVSEKHRRLIGTVLTSDDYANIPTANVGRIIPWVWGTVNGFKPILVDDNITTQLSAAMLAADVVAHVQSADDFPATGSIRINGEVMSYTAIDTTDSEDHQFTGLTRAQESTVATSHVAGNQVIEYNAVQYLVANHDCNSIGNVRYIADDGTACLVDSGDYTVTLRKPARIDFTQSPTVLVPSAAHKLKTVEMDDVYYNSGVDNPEYAVGGDADWTEYNYATFDGSDILTLRRTAAVDAPGKLIRAFLVIEHWQSAAAALYSHWNADVTGYEIPYDTDTPVDVMEDHSIHSMSAGFEDQHTHEIPGAIHQHYLGSSSDGALVPDIDTYDDTSVTWGTKDNMYDGNMASYDDITLSGSPDKIIFNYVNVPESINLQYKITKVRTRIRYESTGAASADTRADFYIRGTAGGSSDLHIVLAITLPEDETEYLSDWYDVSSSNLYSMDMCNAYFVVDFTGGGSDDVRIYDVESFFVLEDAGYGVFAYEPCDTVAPSGYTKTIDGNLNSYDTITLTDQPEFRWLGISNTADVIDEVALMVAGGYGECTATLYINGSSVGSAVMDMWHYGTAYEYGTTIKFTNIFTPSGGTYTGNDLLLSNTYIKLTSYLGYSTCRVIDVGMWVKYIGNDAAWTGNTDIGDSDQQEGDRSHLHWLDVSDVITDWSDIVNKQAAIVCQSGTNEGKVLRVHYACEFAPQETKQVKDIVCDVSGRTGTTQQMLNDIAMESDLCNIPSGSVDIPESLTDARAGAVTEHVDGLVLLDNVLIESRCHGYWGWDGVFHARARVNRQDLPAASIEFTDCISIVRGIRELDELVTRVQAFYNYTFSNDTWGADETVKNSISEAKHDTERVESADFYFTRVQADAIQAAAFLLSYLDECFETVDVTEGVYGMNVEPGDTISVDTEGVDSDKIEVKEVRLNGLLTGELTTELRGVDYS